MSICTTSSTRGRVIFGIVCAVAAIAYLVVGLVRHEVGFAIAGPAIMVCYGVGLLVLGRRSEPLALLSGDLGDERQVQLVQRSTAATGQVLLVILVVGAVWSLAVDAQNAMTFCWLCAAGGLSFIGATIWFARRG